MVIPANLVAEALLQNSASRTAPIDLNQALGSQPMNVFGGANPNLQGLPQVAQATGSMTQAQHAALLQRVLAQSERNLSRGAPETTPRSGGSVDPPRLTKGQDLTKREEGGVRPNPYPDSKRFWTVGVGELIYKDGKRFKATKDEVKSFRNRKNPSKTYKVKKGDTLSKIARKHKLPLKKLRKLNPDYATPTEQDRDIQIDQKFIVRASGAKLWKDVLDRVFGKNPLKDKYYNVSEDVHMNRFKANYNKASTQTIDIVGADTWDKLSQQWQDTLTDLTFQAGSGKPATGSKSAEGLRGFRKMLHALWEGREDDAAYELTNADRATADSPGRALRALQKLGYSDITIPDSKADQKKKVKAWLAAHKPKRLERATARRREARAAQRKSLVE